MKKVFFMFFVLFNLNAQYYDYSAKVDIQGELRVSTTNLNEIYNKLGEKYVGYGYYICSWIEGQGPPRCKMKDIQPRGFRRIGGSKYENKIKFREGNRNRTLLQLSYQIVSIENGFPMMKRSEVIEVTKELKELYELGLMSQQQYNSEMNNIRDYLSRN